MRVTTQDLMLAGWHCGWINNRKLWSWRFNPTKESGCDFHQAVRLYKGGLRDKK